MEWDKDQFISEASGLFDNEDHKNSIDATLPNNGDGLDKICRTGFAQLERNFDALSAAKNAHN